MYSLHIKGSQGPPLQISGRFEPRILQQNDTCVAVEPVCLGQPGNMTFADRSVGLDHCTDLQIGLRS